MHAIVKDYVETADDLAQIADRWRGESSPVARAVALLSRFISDPQSASGAIAAARKVVVADDDPDLSVLFLSLWARAVLSQAGMTGNREETTRSALRRARSLVSPATVPEVAAFLVQTEAALAGADGNHATREKMLRSALSALPAKSPRRMGLLRDLAGLLAQTGRLDTIEPEFQEQERKGLGLGEWVHLCRFVNVVEAGRLALASRLAERAAQASTTAAAARLSTRYHALLRLMNARPGRPGTAVADTDGALPDWGLVIHCLLNGRVQPAIGWARLCEKRAPVAVTECDCLSYNLIRAELAQGNAEAALRLIEMRHARGNMHYLDGLFMARVELLNGNNIAAAARFAEMLAAADEHRAAGRLDFELRMAAEVPRDMLFRLARSAAAPPRKLAGRRLAAVRLSRTDTPGQTGVDRLIGVSAAIGEIRARIRRFASLDSQVLITGETGTGKELVARALHETGPAAREPFLAINCGAIPESLLESELFGHERGAFSGASAAHRGLFEEAGRGTILLDEIGDISPRLQVALLRVLESGDVRPVGSPRSRRVACRILASTNADLDRLAEDGRFRSDLIFRLRRLQVHVPALRERREDILPLAEHFLNAGRPAGVYAMMSEALAEALRRHAWPGNVRELRNTVERMRLMNSDKLQYDVEDLDIDRPVAEAGSRRLVAPEPPAAAPMSRFPDAAAAIPPPVAVRVGPRLRRLERIRCLFHQHRMLTRGEVIGMLGTSPNTATRDLRILCDEGYIRRIAPTASPRSVYFELGGPAEPRPPVRLRPPAPSAPPARNRP